MTSLPEKTDKKLGLVIDLGGGTSDFSIVRVSPERARATAETA